MLRNFTNLEKIQLLFGRKVIIRNYNSVSRTGKIAKPLMKHEQLKPDLDRVKSLRDYILREYTGLLDLTEIKKVIAEIKKEETLPYSSDKFDYLYSRLIPNGKIPKEVIYSLIACSRVEPWKIEIYNKILAIYGDKINVIKNKKYNSDELYRGIDECTLLLTEHNNNIMLKLNGTKIKKEVLYKDVLTTTSREMADYIEGITGFWQSKDTTLEKDFFIPMGQVRLKYSNNTLSQILRDLPLPIALGQKFILDKYKYSSMFKEFILEKEMPKEVKLLFTLQQLYSALRGENYLYLSSTENLTPLFRDLLQPKEFIYEKDFIATSSYNQSDLKELIIFSEEGDYNLLVDNFTLDIIGDTLSKFNKINISESSENPTKLKLGNGKILDLRAEVFRGKEYSEETIANNVLKISQTGE